MPHPVSSAQHSTADPAPGRDLDALIDSLDLESKVVLLTGATAFTLAGDDRIGLREMAFSDGPTGVRGLTFTGGDAVALLPNATLLAGAWDADAAYEIGQIVAEEAERQHIHVVLGPTINLHRTALGGRLFEAYSEDPLLTGRIAAGYVRGVQDRGIGACLKHLVGNESETERHGVDSRIDEKTLRELYLLPFEIALSESDAWTLMAAYNDVNGVAATEHDEINNGIVKAEWGYTGLIMSDWFATQSTAASANGGLDLVMPGPTGPWGDALVAAVRAGEVAESTVDDHLRRLLRLADRVQALGTDRQWTTEPVAADSALRQEQLTRLAAAGMTVLTNDGTLPLAGGPDGPTVALIGRHAVDTITMGGGSAQVTPPYSITVEHGLRARLGTAVTVTDGVEVRTKAVPASSRFATDPVTGAPGVRFVYLDAEGAVISERTSASGMALIGFDEVFDRPISSVVVSAVIDSGGPTQVGVIGLGPWDVEAASTHERVILLPEGADPGEALLKPPSWTTEVDLTAGTVVRATTYLDLPEWTRDSDVPVGLGLPPEMASVRMLGLVARPAPRDADVVIAEAVSAAAAADVAVVVVGLTEEQETEAVDKTTLALPGRQDELVSAVAAPATKTVVVVNAATPVLMPWVDEVDAVVVIGLPGQEGGHAVAAALLGDLEPSGRLVTSYPVVDGASPAWGVTPTDGALVYAEGGLMGYRGYATGAAQPPAFWFGHGLGYGTWSYGEPVASGGVAPDGTSSIDVTVQVTNTGDRVSREVVQVYFDPAETDEAIRLVGWTAVTVAPGETQTVAVACDARMWRRWDLASHDWAPLGSGGELVIARGLGDIRGRVPVA